jgi:hypothetical protein
MSISTVTWGNTTRTIAHDPDGHRAHAFRRWLERRYPALVGKITVKLDADWPAVL